MPRTVRIGLVGAGRILPAHLRGYAALRQSGVDNFRITAICSRDRQRALTYRQRGEGPPPPAPASRRAGAGLGAPHRYVSDFQDDLLPEVFDDVGPMLDSGLVDAVDITTEVAQHHVQAIRCLEAGVHVLVEKPLAITVRAGLAMVRAAEQHGAVLAVCENAHSTRPLPYAAWLVHRGDLGRPQVVFSWSFGSPEWSPNRAIANTPWRHRRLAVAAGAPVESGVHVFHRLRMLCGEIASVSGVARTLEPERVVLDDAGQIASRVVSEASDTYLATLIFENGAIGQVASSFAGHGEPTPAQTPLLYGTRGCITGDTLFLDGAPPEPLERYFLRHATAQDHEALFPGGLTDPFGLRILDWLTAIAEGRAAETSGQDGLQDLAAGFALAESSLLGRSVTLAEVLDGRTDGSQRNLDEHYGLLESRHDR